MPTYETLLADASLLPIEDHIQLIDAIWESLPEHSLPALSDEWVAEIQKRSAEYVAGFGGRNSPDSVSSKNYYNDYGGVR